MRSRRSAFTPIKILVVITIPAIVAVLVVMAFRGDDTQKVREGGRIVQSSILGARERAMLSGKRRGIRITPDPSDVNLGLGLVYVQPLENSKYPPGSFSLERLDADTDGVADTPDVVILHGLPGNVDWDALRQSFPTNPRIRIPVNNGRWYPFQVNTTGPYALAGGSLYLQLTTPFGEPGIPSPAVVAFPAAGGSEFTSGRIDLGTEVLSMYAPIRLPSGVVFDLNNSSAAARGDILFSSRGIVTEPASEQDPIYLLLRDVRDVTEGISPTNTKAGVIHRDMLIVAIFPATGQVQSYPVDQTDADNNGTADDLFQFAKRGSAAGG